MKHTIREELHGVVAFVGAMWGVYALDWVVPGKFSDWGIVPRTLWGLVGIPLAPFLHAGFGHLLSNTVPLVILLVLFAGSRARTWPAVAEMILLGGGLLWLFGRTADHVGASILIYSLIAFLIVSGFREKRLVPIGIALLVGFLYGSTLFFGVLPTAGPGISWDGHLCGAIAGALLGYFSVGADSSPTPMDP
ncbi:MAG: rhomboid family intramembrane serine protease [Pirellulaceae bacterium]